MLEFKFLSVVLALMFSDPIAETQNKIVEINSSSTPAIQPIPDFQNETVAFYDAAGSRNPFHGKSLHREMSMFKPVKVYVDLNRSKQELERFSMRQLVMTGVLKKAKSYDAMIRTPEGKIIVAGIGEYIGENHGRIKKINPEGIDVAEAVDDGKGGYIERMRHLALMENHKVDGI